MKKLTILALSLILSTGMGARLKMTRVYILITKAICSVVSSPKPKTVLKSELTVEGRGPNRSSQLLLYFRKTDGSGTFTNGAKDMKMDRYNENGTVSAIAFYNLGKNRHRLVYDEKATNVLKWITTTARKAGVWTSWDSGAVAGTRLQQGE